MSRFNKFVLDNPKIIIGVLAIITIIFAAFIPQISFDADMEQMIPDDDPVIKDLEEAIEDFGSQDFLMIALRSDNIFNAGTLKKIDELTNKIEKLDGVKKVMSPLNVDLIESSVMGIEINPIVDKLPQTEEEIDKYRQRILNSSNVGKLVTADGKAAAIMVTMEPFGDLSTQKMKALTAKIDKIVNSYRDPEEIYIVGDTYVGHYAENAMGSDMRVLMPLVVLILVGILYWSFHSARGVLLPLATVIISVIWTVGLMVILGIPLTIVTMVMPIILVAIGSADGIHILNKYYEELALGRSKRKALEETMREMNGPVIMTSLTTGAGFAALITSFVTPIRQFGLLTAFGVLAAMFFSLLFIPAALVLQKLPAHFNEETREHKEWLVKGLTVLGKFMAKHAKVIVGVSAVILLIFIFGAFNLSLESNMMNYFEEDSPIVKGTDIVEDEFGGTIQVSIVFDTGKKDGVKEPVVLKKMVETQEYLNSLPHVSQASSLADLVRELNQALNMGEEEYYRIPDTRQAVAQELLLFTMQGGSGIDTMVSYNFDKAIVNARIENMGSGELKKVIDKIEGYVENKFAGEEDLEVKVVGLPKVMLRLMDRFIASQISSLVTSVVTVGIIVALLMGSWLAGLVSILPLVLTVGINFGIMGYSGIPLDAVTTMIASIAIGIGVDYSIHYLSRYRNEIRNGKSQDEAIAITSATAGRGIFFNALTLILGFGILIFSHFRAIDVFGYLIALTMLISSLASLTVIPGILRLMPARAILRKKYRELDYEYVEAN